MIYYILLGLFLALFVNSSGLLLRFRSNEPIKSRGWPLVICSNIFGAIHFCFLCYNIENFMQEGWTCPLTVWPAAMFIPLWSFPHFIRCFVLYQNHKRGVAILSANYSHPILSQKKLTDVKNLFGVYIVSIAVNLVIVGAIYASTPLDELCRGAIDIWIITQFIIALFLQALFVYLLWKVEDNFGIKTEMKLILLSLPPCLILWFLPTFRLVPMWFEPTWSPQLFILWSQLCSAAYPVVLFFYQRKKAKINISRVSNQVIFDITTSSHENEALHHVIEHQILLESFKDWCSKSWCLESLLFYIETMNFESIDPLKAKSEAQKIFEMYISDSGPLSINIDDSLRKNIQKELQNSFISSSIFEPARKEVFELLSKDTLVKWRISANFREMIKSLRTF